MAPSPTTRTLAVALSLAAALLWATYYLFVLGSSPAAAPSAVLVYPFLFGGIAYAGWAVRGGHGRAFLALWRSPASYGRVSLLVAMQLGVLAVTYLAGPVDASLLSLIGDVVVTPLVVAYLLGIGRAHVHTAVFAVGLLLCLAGGTLTIVAEGRLTAVSGWVWPVLVAVPIAVAFFFLLTARENERSPPSAVVAQSMLAGAVVTALLAPAVPGGWTGLVAVPAVPLGLLAVCGVTSFFVAPLFYFTAIGKVGLVIPPMLMTAIPVFTLFLSAGVLGISIPLLGAVGIPVAVVGALLALRGEPSADAAAPVAGASP